MILLGRVEAWSSQNFALGFLHFSRADFTLWRQLALRSPAINEPLAASRRERDVRRQNSMSLK